MKYLADSTWVIDLLSGQAAAVGLYPTLLQEGLAVSIVTYMELWEGVYTNRDPRRAAQGLRNFLAGAGDGSRNASATRGCRMTRWVWWNAPPASSDSTPGRHHPRPAKSKVPLSVRSQSRSWRAWEASTSSLGT